MRCDDLEPLIEAIADGSHELSAEDAAHVASCAICAPRIERARSIESLLSMREVAQPPAAFTLAVMARVSRSGGRPNARSISDSISPSPPASW